MDKPQYRTFEAFWAYYLSQHSLPQTRWFHLAGTICGLAVGVAAVTVGRPLLLIAAPIVAYGAAWLSHMAFEHNKPVTFQYPLWSARGDFRMIGRMLTGHYWRGEPKQVAQLRLKAREREEARLKLATVMRGEPRK